MNDDFSIEPLQIQRQLAIKQLEDCNLTTARYGLTLSADQIINLVEGQEKALVNTDRFEFGEGILKRLIDAFCDSPYLTQETYEETIAELAESFYYFKNESEDSIEDDELIAIMRKALDAQAGGSLDFLCGCTLEELCRKARFGGGYEEEEDDGDGFLF